MEVFKNLDIEGFEGIIRVSTYGQIHWIRSGKYTFGYNCQGYRYVTLKNNKVRKNLRVHRAVLLAFKENPYNKPYINHIDGNKFNNRLDNLEWSTQSENMKHAVKERLCTNSSLKGEKHNTSKHSDIEVERIRSDYYTGNYSMRKLAYKYNTSSGYISDIINNKIRVNK